MFCREKCILQNTDKKKSSRGLLRHPSGEITGGVFICRMKMLKNDLRGVPATGLDYGIVAHQLLSWCAT